MEEGNTRRVIQQQQQQQHSEPKPEGKKVKRNGTKQDGKKRGKKKENIKIHEGDI